LTSADGEATAAREAAHASELEIGRLQQQMTFDRQQVTELGTTRSDIEAEIGALEVRREPVGHELESRRHAAARACVERDEAASVLISREAAYADAQRRIEGLEADVEAARSEVFAAVNAATALRHAMDHAASARMRLIEQIAKLDVETSDLRVEAERVSRERLGIEESLARARNTMDGLRLERSSRESELLGTRGDRDARARELRTREHDLASLTARLKSLEELDAARAEYGDGARTILAESQSDVAHMGSVADYLEVNKLYERAVEAYLGAQLQYVVVRSHEHAAAGLRLATERNAGRVGFVICARGAPPPRAHALRATAFGLAAPRPHPARGGPQCGDPSAAPEVRAGAENPSHLKPLAEVVCVSGPAAEAILEVLVDAWIAPDFDSARAAADETSAAIVTLEGAVFRGAHTVEGGERTEARGILTTKREIKELRERADEQRVAVERLREEITSLDVRIAAIEVAIMALQGELHRQEKAVVGFELQLTNAAESAERIARKRDQIGVERRSAEEEQRSQEARQEEARESIARIETEQKAADAQLNSTQRRLFDAREEMQSQAHRAAEAKAAHAALVERASALAAEVRRLEEASAELDTRLASRREDVQRTETRRVELQQAIAISEEALNTGVGRFDELRERVRQVDEKSQALRVEFDEQDGRIREGRRMLEAVRAEAAQLDVARATAEADLSHLASSCFESVQVSLDDVAAEVEQLERDGLLASPAPVDDAPEPAEVEEDAAASAQSHPAQDTAAVSGTLTPDEMVIDLRAKIERMGAVNMMAIDQFDDLESRHAFLTAQRKDLVDSIAATGEAIKKIDKTTRERFGEAFSVINHNFEQTFTTLFGGGRAGLVLIDESDQLESGIDIIAQPPGKRLQSIQLLSGGEKALTAMALMFAIFKYRPSPFCLLDEIDAPLDDANIGRFVEMLQGMQDQTQFILITHNRKTMEIADRLYGVTMEEPGVSKLISVQLN
jgi:chromosome segregation protein